MGAAVLLPAAVAGVAAGILIQDGAPGVPVVASLPLAAGALLVALVRARGRASVAALATAALLAGLAIGAWRGSVSALPVGPGSLASFIDTGTREIQGTLVDEPRPRGVRQQAILDAVRVAAADGSSTPAAGRLLVWLPRSLALQVGDRIAVQSPLEAPRDFEDFAYRAYLARQGIAAIGSARVAQLVTHDLGALPDAIARLRRGLLGGLQSLVPEPEAALGAGILLGARSEIAPEVSDAFATAGLTHVVAISGWNIAIVAAVVAALTRPLLRRRGGRPLAVGLSIVAVGAYVLLTGASPSVVRAALMAGALLLARLGGSRAHAISALLLAALVMLLVAPPILWDVGFQLSALATAGLIWFGAAIEWRLRRWPTMLREPVALTLAAQMTTLPVILLNFERLSLVAPLANVLVVPLVPVVMLCTALAAGTGLVEAHVSVPLLGELLAWAAGGGAWLYLRLMIGIGELAASLPFASLDLAAPAWMAAAWYPLLPLVRRRLQLPDEEHRALHVEAGHPGLATGLARPLPLALITLGLVALLTLATQPDGRTHLAMLDIGQGDAIVVRAPSGATLLVDGGPDPGLAMRRLGEELPFWQRTIDVLLLTHPHEDHVAGLVAALERFRVRLVVDSSRPYPNPTYTRFLADARAESGARLVGARAGMRIALDPSATLTILYPTDADLGAPLPEGDINNASVVSRLDADGMRVLLMGDAEAPVERALLTRGLLGPADVLKVGHHGSNSSTTDALLATVVPRVALISAGIDNEYGHPHRVTLDKLAALPGLVVRRTDLEGTVRLSWDGSGRASSAASSILVWPFLAASVPSSSSPATSCRRASSSTRAASSASPARPRSSWRRAASPSTWASSRSPPCSTTSTSPSPGGAVSSTACWRPAG